MGPILSMIKRIEFVNVGEVDVVFEANGKLFKKRAYVNCSLTTFTFKVDAFWNPQAPQPVEGVVPKVEAAPT